MASSNVGDAFEGSSGIQDSIQLSKFASTSFRLLAKRETDVHNEEKDKHLKKREEFAISLRKKKHCEIITTKRKAIMLKAFERTTEVTSGGIEFQQKLSGDLQTYMIKDEVTLLQMIDYLEKAPPSERLNILIALRILTISSEDYRLLEIVENSQDLILKLCNLLTSDDMQMTFQDRSECMWILTNISCNPQVSYNMLTQWNVYSLIQTLYRTHFIHDQVEFPSPLNDQELAFLEQLMWFTANIAADGQRSQADAILNNIDYLLGVVLHNYHSQFKESLWRIFTWCLSILSMGLQHIKDPHFDVFEAYMLIHFPAVKSLVIDNPAVDDTDKESLKSDVMTMISNVIKNCSDEQIKIITSEPQLQAFAYSVFIQFQMKNVSNCVRFFGNLFAINDQACSEYVKNREFMLKLQDVFTYCTKVIRKEALWLVSNIAANSEADAIALTKYSIMSNLMFAGRDTAHDMRKEAIWAISNVVYNIKDKANLDEVLKHDLMTLLLERLQYDNDSGPICSMTLTTVGIILERSQNAKQVFFRLGGDQILEDVQISPYHEIYKQAADLLEKHCGGKAMEQLEKMEFLSSRQPTNNFNI